MGLIWGLFGAYLGPILGLYWRLNGTYFGLIWGLNRAYFCSTFVKGGINCEYKIDVFWKKIEMLFNRVSE